MRDRSLTPIAGGCPECGASDVLDLIDCEPPPIPALLEDAFEGRCVRTPRWRWCATGVLDVPGAYRCTVERR